MALTLAEAQKHATGPQELAVISELASGQLMSVLPFRDIEGNGLFWNREEELPEVNFRNYNANPVDKYGVVAQQSESLKLFGGDIKVDRAIVELEGAEARAYQIQARVRSMRLAWERLFIKGNSNSNPSEFDGLQARLGDTPGTDSQVINGTSNSGRLTQEKLDELIDAVDAAGGQRYLIMSKSARRKVSAMAAQLQSPVEYSRNEFGMQQMVYGGVPIIEIDRDEQNNPILDAQTTQDIYCVTFGPQLLTGIQNGGVSVRDLGESTSTPHLVTRLDWYCGLALVNGRAAARLKGINTATALA